MEAGILESILKGTVSSDESYLRNLYAAFEHNPQIEYEEQRSNSEDETTLDYFLSRIRLMKRSFRWVPICQESIARFGKSDKISIDFREKTDKYICGSHMSFELPLRGYNLAIAFAAPKSKELASAYEKRAELFLRLGKLELARNDINIALNLVTGKNTQKLIRLLKRCDLGFNEIPTNTKTSQEHSENHIFVPQTPNPLLNKLNSSVDIDYHPACGGRIIATKVIRPGEVLIVDEPFELHVEKILDWDTEHCSNCSKPTVGGIPCTDCTFGWFCSEVCRNQANNLGGAHTFEHKFLAYLKSSGIKSVKAVLASRILFKVGPCKLHRIFQSREPSYFNSFEPGDNFASSRGLISNYKNQNLSDSYLPIFGLISHPPTSPAKAKSNEFTAVLLCHFIEESTEFFTPYKTTEDYDGFKDFIASLLLKHMESIPYNAITLSEMVHNDVRRYGAAVYPVLCLVNHSCMPNCVPVRSWRLGKTALVAMKNITIGEEVTFSYAPHFSQMATQERQMYLLNNYNFVCACDACRAGLEPDHCRSLRILESQCEACKWYPLTGQCPKCMKKDVDLANDLTRLQAHAVEVNASIERGEYYQAFEMSKFALDFCLRHWQPNFPILLEFEQLFKRALVGMVTS